MTSRRAPSPPARGGNAAMSASAASPPPPSGTASDKGEGSAASASSPPPSAPTPETPLPPTDWLSAKLDEALNSDLDLPPPQPHPAMGRRRSGDTVSPPRISADSLPPEMTLARPPQAHYSAGGGSSGGGFVGPGLRPRLMTNLSQTSAPTASLTYANAEDFRPRQRERFVSAPQASDANHHWDGPHLHHHLSRAGTPVGADGNASRAFPDLDPATGLPLPSPELGPDGEPRYQVQRTISELSRRGSGEQPATAQGFLNAFPAMPSLPGMPAMPSLPSMPSMQQMGWSIDGGRRSLSMGSPGAWGQRFFSTNKSRIDSMLSPEDQGETRAEEEQKHQAKYTTPKNPLVFCHGLLGFDILGPANLPPLQISHWRGIREVLERSGCEVLICRVPATGSIKERAEVLNDTIQEKYPGRTVNLIAHSMGGLDCRYLISKICPDKFDIASLTTISTPHRGSPFADYVIDNVIGRDRLPQLLSVMEAMNLPNSGDGSAFAALGTRAMRQFNTEVIDDPNVQYYSWGARFEPGLFDTFRWPWSVIYAKEGPNDGMVSVMSAQWGEYRGTLLGVNHLDLVGWVNQVRYMMSSLTGNPITFKPATFYLEISDYLAKQGF